MCPLLSLQVKVAATEAGVATFKLVGNRDIEHILDDLLHCVARPAEVPDVVTKLSATTFVQVGGRGGLGTGAAAAAVSFVGAVVAPLRQLLHLQLQAGSSEC